MTPLSPSRATRVALVLAGLLIALYAGAQGDDYQEASRLFRSGQQLQALDRVDNFLKANPKDARARFLKGLILTEQNKSSDAIKVFTGLTEDYPELPEPYNNLAVLYASQGQYDRARTALQMAIRTHPSYATAHENLGDIYAKMASQAYDKALQLDKSNTAAQTKLELIKDLFAGSARGARTIGSKADAGARTAPVAVASSTPGAGKPASPAATFAEPGGKPAARFAEPGRQAGTFGDPGGRQTETFAEPGRRSATSAAPARASAAAAGAEGEVLQAVNSWASAWSSKDVSGYLGFYAPDFQTPGGEPRARWEATRRARIEKPRKIDVRIRSPKVKIAANNHATVTFRQDYRSSNLKASGTKTLVMVKTGDRWLIQQERSSN